MNCDEFAVKLRAQVEAEGGISKFSENHQLSESYLKNVMYCGVKPGPKIALALGMKKVITFEPIK